MSFRLVDPVGVLEARGPTRCADAIAAAEAAAARGLWVAGFVAYEAAPGLDPALGSARTSRADPFARLPLAWFAMFEGGEETLLPEPPGDAPRRDRRRVATRPSTRAIRRRDRARSTSTSRPATRTR